MAILVTGGTGYIGSHTVVELLDKGYEVIIVDNLCNSSKVVLNRIQTITGQMPIFYQVDCTNILRLRSIFQKHQIEAIVHFAGLKAVGESVEIPLRYYQNNLDSSLVILKLMEEFSVKNLVFSSSATVYGDPQVVPITEDCEVGRATNPYGKTKAMIEDILIDVQKANPTLNITILRYFNPIGAHISGLIGENPNGIPNNLMPYITQVAIGKLPSLGVFGNDYKTLDGTGVRDYIHVVDLALGHVAALKKMTSNPGLLIYNLGTGRGTSVLEMVHAFEKANNIRIPYIMKPRRPGDIDASFADCQKANRELKWFANRTIEDACRDSWNFQTKNPRGFEE